MKKLRLEVPESVVFEILLRLPARSLCRFRAVSTSWRSIISDPYFIRSRAALAKTSANLVVVASYKDISWEGQVYDLDCSVQVAAVKVPKRFEEFIASRSVHGLICLATQAGSDMCIMNTTTREYITVPLPRPDGEYVYHWLGFDPAANKHKVLFAYRTFDPHSRSGLALEHWVFTLGSEEERWRRVEGISPYHLMPRNNFQDEVCINGVIYALACTNSNSSLSPCCYLAAFDLKSESLKLLELPDPGFCQFMTALNLKKYPSSLIQFDGSVALVHNLPDRRYRRRTGPPIQPRFDGWVLLDDLGDKPAVWEPRTWVLNLDSCWEKIRGRCRGLHLACSLRGGEVLVFKPIEPKGGGRSLDLFFYNVKSNDCWSTRIDLQPAGGKALARSDYRYIDIYGHEESFLPLGGSSCSLEGLSESSDSSSDKHD